MSGTSSDISGFNISIDGGANALVKETGTSFPNVGSGYAGNVLVYEKTGLSLGIHTVKIAVVDKSVVGCNRTACYLDAIDIDDTGALIDPSAVLGTGITLNKTIDTLNVGRTDTLAATITPDNATNKAVNWT